MDSGSGGLEWGLRVWFLTGSQVMSVLLLVGDHTLNKKVCADGVLLPEVNLFQVFSKISLSVGWRRREGREGAE